MRTIQNAASLSDTLTAPIYLVKLNFSIPFYLSSGPEVSWDGATWQEEGIVVRRVEVDTLGRAAISLAISNLDRIMGQLVLGQPTKDRFVQVYAYYPSGSAGAIDPIFLVDGVIDGASVGEVVSFRVISKSAWFGSTPRLICGPPTFNHLPPDGTILRWGYNELILKSAR